MRWDGAGPGGPADQAEASPSRRRLLRDALLAAAGLAGLTTWPVGAASRTAQPEITMLQTAASLENLAVAVYTNPAVQNLIVGTQSRLLVAFFTRTVEQHSDHGRAFNSAAMALGGEAQTRPDEVLFDSLVGPAVSRLSTAADVLALAADLEDVAAQTQVRFVADARATRAIEALAAIAPVEAQHAGTLAALLAMLAAGRPLSALELPPDPDGVPVPAVMAAAPHAYHPTVRARPAGEGSRR